MLKFGPATERRRECLAVLTDFGVWAQNAIADQLLQLTLGHSDALMAEHAIRAGHHRRSVVTFCPLGTIFALRTIGFETRWRHECSA
jgi:hypothetical protein